jgi:hypothetical protein
VRRNGRCSMARFLQSALVDLREQNRKPIQRLGLLKVWYLPVLLPRIGFCQCVECFRPRAVGIIEAGELYLFKIETGEY